MAQPDINYTKEAFLNPWNLGFLIVAMLAAFVLSGEPVAFNLILLMTAAAELVYLGVLPKNERFRRVTRAQKIKEHHKPLTARERYKQLKSRSQRRYSRLKMRHDRIRENYQKLSYASQGLLDSHLNKIEGLLESYLNLLFQRDRYEDYLDAATESELVRSIEALHEDMSDDSERVRAVKERRMQVLQQRLARFKRSRENLEIIDAQIATIEDVVAYIHEQSLTLQNPEEITFQLDTLLAEVEETRAAVEEVEDVFRETPAGGRLGPLDVYDLDEPEEEDSAPPRSDRLRS